MLVAVAGRKLTKELKRGEEAKLYVWRAQSSSPLSPRNS